MDLKKIDKQTRYRKTKQVLGEGSYKTVTKAIDEEEGKEVAYNEVRIKNYEFETKAETSFSKEIALLKAIDHPNIIQIIDYWFSDDNFTFITEFMTGGSLTDYIEKNGPLNTKLIRKWGKQILEGLAYLHNQDPPIIHRDIKNENIFVNTAVGDVKIGDLGLARERRSKRYTVVGTPHFMAREMFEGEGYTEKVDIYAFGMCLIEMATGIRPYNEFSDTKDIYKSVLQGIFPKALQSITEPCLKSLIVSCLVPTGFRFTSLQCLDHHFFHHDVACNGECVPQECVAVYPLVFEPIKNMELSIISIFEETVTFQILLYKTMKFIKFEYDLKVDTVENVSAELLNERIIDEEDIVNFSNLLTMGLATVESKMKIGKAHDGIIELNSLETLNIKNKDMVISNKIRSVVNEIDSSSSEREVPFGTATLEEMSLIEERMKIHAAKLELERRKEDEITFRLKSKLLKKDASYEPELLQKEESFPINENVSGHIESNAAATLSQANNSETKINQSESINTVSKHNSPGCMNSNQVENLQSSPISNSNVFKENQDLENSKLVSYKSSEFEVSNVKSSDTISQNEYENKIESLGLSEESSFSKPNNFASEIDHSQEEKEFKAKCEENIYLQFPQVDKKSHEHSKNLHICSTSSIPQHLEETLTKIESLNLSDFKDSKNMRIEFPLKSPPFANEMLTEELAVSDLSLSASYQRTKLKYKVNTSIAQFVAECAMITGRTEETAKSWIKALKEEHIEKVFDLKLMVYEDWEKLPLTVFASRAMQNMIYGIDGTPLKEKQLPLNPKIKEYENEIKIRDFLLDICSLIGRNELVSSWEDRLLAEDIQTVGELKSLHQDDWNRLGLSVLGHRILKNTIQRKGRIFIDDLN